MICPCRDPTVPGDLGVKVLEQLRALHRFTRLCDKLGLDETGSNTGGDANEEGLLAHGSDEEE